MKTVPYHQEPVQWCNILGSLALDLCHSLCDQQDETSAVVLSGGGGGGYGDGGRGIGVWRWGVYTISIQSARLNNSCNSIEYRKVVV